LEDLKFNPLIEMMMVLAQSIHLNKYVFQILNISFVPIA